MPVPLPTILQADETARLHLAVHGRFSLGFLPLADFPALDFGGGIPTLLHASLAPSLHALTLVVKTKVCDYIDKRRVRFPHNQRSSNLRSQNSPPPVAHLSLSSLLWRDSWMCWAALAVSVGEASAHAEATVSAQRCVEWSAPESP